MADTDPHSLNHKASQDTLISLLQLDPAPIENGTYDDKELPPLPEEAMESSASTIRPESTTTASTSSLGLSGSGRGPIYYLSRIQRYSSYTFTFFAGLHLANTSIFPLIYQSVPYSEPFLLLSREIYQTPLTEPLLVGLPIVAHVASGLAIRLLRRRQNLKRYGGATPGVWPLHHANRAPPPPASADSKSSSSSHNSNNNRKTQQLRRNGWPPLSYISISGYVFTCAVAAHVAMNRILPLIVEGDSSNIGLQYVAHGFARHGLQAWVAYAVLLGSGAAHMVWGWAKWMDVAPPIGWRRSTVDRTVRRRRRRAWWGIQGAALALAALWAAGGLGVVARGGPVDGWLGRVYDAIYSRAGQ
ncbi:DUF1691-domain-containing protein [Xylariomycetidae sp. FL2044]|nr:DUF1691-domain-containing protein [Xylariomycetidae sp. FL2044]